MRVRAGYMPFLEQLSLARNQLTCTADTCDGGTTLTLNTRARRIDLSRNLYALVDVLSAPRLEVLNLSGSYLLSSLSFTGAPESLTELYLDYAPVSKLPDLRGVPLRVLSAGHTKVANVDALAAQGSLMELVVDYSQLSTMPDWSVDMPGMQISALPHCEYAPQTPPLPDTCTAPGHIRTHAHTHAHTHKH
jgi:hypothetical protein